MSAQGTSRKRISVRRSARLFLVATCTSHFSQFVWLAAGSRVMPETTFGEVLSAQVLYAVMQIVVDNGTGAFGARQAARGDVPDPELGQLVRLRLILSGAAIGVGLTTGALFTGLAATAPYMAALALFALFNVWRPYGEGDPRPWAAYMFGRSALPAAAALAVAVAGGSFPAPLAGVLECVVIVVLVGVTGQHPLRELRLALRVRGGPWRSTLFIGVPAVLQQGGVAAGTIALSVSGAVRAAGVFAACVRLLTGLNALNGIIATAMFPSLAERGGVTVAASRIAIAFRLVTAAAFAATAVVCGGASLIARLLLDQTSHAIESALVLTTAAGAGMGTVVILTYLLVAADGERRVLPAYVAGTVVTVAGAGVVVGTVGQEVDAVAVTLLLGQLTAMAGLVRAVARLLPDYNRSTRLAGLGALGLGGGALAGAVTGATVATGAVLAVAAVVMLLGGGASMRATLGVGRASRAVGAVGARFRTAKDRGAT